MYYFFILQMNVNNQMTPNMKQLRFQMPVTCLKSFANSVNELMNMYPFPEAKKDEEDK